MAGKYLIARRMSGYETAIVSSPIIMPPHVVPARNGSSVLIIEEIVWLYPIISIAPAVIVTITPPDLMEFSKCSFVRKIIMSEPLMPPR